MADCLLGLGSNLDDRVALLNEAVRQFCDHPGVQLLAQSGCYQTAAIGGPANQGDYLNAAFRIQTELSPSQLLERSLLVERQLGRHRVKRWAQRRIDIDLLLYDQRQVRTTDLVIPHPRMAVRHFVLLPANEIASDMIHPDTGWSVRILLTRLMRRPHYLALAGLPGAGKTTLTSQLTPPPGAAQMVVLSDHRLSGNSRVSMPGATKAAADPTAEWIQRCAQRAEQLHKLQQRLADGTLATSSIVLSDDWLPQAKAAARVLLDVDQQEQVEAACLKAERSFPVPHLVLFLDTPLDTIFHRWTAAHRPDSSCQLSRAELVRLRDELEIELQKPGQGPVIRIADGDPATARIELEAAMDAMTQIAENRQINSDLGDCSL